jgi:hypothetical protein
MWVPVTTAWHVLRLWMEETASRNANIILVGNPEGKRLKRRWGMIILE